MDPEYELLDTGAFDEDRYWIVEVHYAKADPHDLLMSIQVTNAGPEADTLHVLPTAWFRNTWSWEFNAPKPELAATGPAAVGIQHPFLGELELSGRSRDRVGPHRRCCSARTRPTTAGSTVCPPARPTRRTGSTTTSLAGAATVNPEGRGTKCAFWYQVDGGPGATVELRLRLRPGSAAPRRPRPRWGAPSTRSSPPGGPRPTSSTPS